MARYRIKKSKLFFEVVNKHITYYQIYLNIGALPFYIPATLSMPRFRLVDVIKAKRRLIQQDKEKK